MDEKEEQVVLDPEYTCITCTHVAVCRWHRNVVEAIRYAPLNPYGSDRPAIESDIYVALANACMYYERTQWTQ